VLCQRVSSKPRLTVADRLLFVWLYRLFPSVLNAVTIVQPETVIRWHRGLPAGAGGRARGRRPKSSVGDPPADPRDEPGQSAVGCAAHPWRTAQTRDLGRAIDGRQVHGEQWRGRPQTWKTFLQNHSSGIGAMGFLIVPTVGFRAAVQSCSVRQAVGRCNIVPSWRPRCSPH
jgi:hypothetical protein